ncbi:hypothetical protein NDU88_004966 [Pleurodeles waltl]|uniref:Syntaxin N-terminal domain-containing protein n=1 Tax=Pleurodeles waltl TaxID=8319 RepID=A0AAV7WA50_PLEWA|nr:hypothetical protein NDU88_004966 [Pleurodeles waltl]
MAAIQDLKVCQDPKMETEMVDVNLLRADFQKLLEKVTTAEPYIHTPQSTSKKLEDQVQYLTKQHINMVAKLEDQEGRVQRNNIRVRLCRSFDELKKALHAKRLKYMMLFPARLRVVAKGKSWYCATPADSWDLLKDWRTPRQRSPEERWEDALCAIGPGTRWLNPRNTLWKKL